jgi:molecular chaperone Hsp33
MSNYFVRAVAGDGNIRAIAAVTTDLVAEAQRRHDTWPVATAALGRSLTAVGLLSATLKEEGESLTLRIAGDGPFRGIICDANASGDVRGYVNNPHVDLDLNPQGKLDVAGGVGQGYVHITRHLALQGVYTGTAEIISGEIAEDIAYYLTTSEQTPSAVSLGVRVSPEGQVVAAGGYLVQLLPATPDADRDQLEANIAALGQVSLAIQEGMTPEEMLHQVLAGLEPKILEKRELRFQCRCSRDRALGALATIESTDLRHMIEEDGGAEMHCHFCNETYRFGEADLRPLLEQNEAN